jgi:hypothetical protein
MSILTMFSNMQVVINLCAVRFRQVHQEVLKRRIKYESVHTFYIVI